MIEAYLDESGIHDGAQVCVVAGFFGKKSGWRALNSRWRQSLRRFDVPLEEFHAKDLVQRGEFFSGWTDHKCAELMSSLASAITASKILPVACGLFVDDFLKFSLIERKFLTGATWNDEKKKFTSTGCPSKPYFVPFQEALRIISVRTPPAAKAHFFFGLGRPFAEYALPYFRYLKSRAEKIPTAKRYTRFATISFPEAKVTPALQAADLFSHLTYRHMLERRQTGDWNSIPSTTLLAILKRRKSPEETVFYTRDTMKIAIASVPLPQ